jgi:integrase
MKTYLKPKEVDRIEQAVECLRDKLLVRLLARLGCRISEALGISVSDIDFDQGTVTIVHLKRRIKLSCPRFESKLTKLWLYLRGYFIAIVGCIPNPPRSLGIPYQVVFNSSLLEQFVQLCIRVFHCNHDEIVSFNVILALSL